MAQYINKATLVAEIEKRLDELYDSLPNASDVVNDNYTKDEANITGKYTALESFSKFLDTFDVKEVDLERELIEWHKEHFKKDGTFIGMSGFYLTNNSQMDIAKHFFELGLKTKYSAKQRKNK